MVHLGEALEYVVVMFRCNSTSVGRFPGKIFAKWRPIATILLLLFSLTSVIVINIGGLNFAGQHSSDVSSQEQEQQQYVPHAVIARRLSILKFSATISAPNSTEWRYYWYLNSGCAVPIHPGTNEEDPAGAVCTYRTPAHVFKPSDLVKLTTPTAANASVLGITPVGTAGPFALYTGAAVCMALALGITVSALAAARWAVAAQRFGATCLVLWPGLCLDLVASAYLSGSAGHAIAQLRAGSAAGSPPPVVVGDVEIGGLFLFLAWAGMGAMMLAVILTFMLCAPTSRRGSAGESDGERGDVVGDDDSADVEDGVGRLIEMGKHEDGDPPKYYKDNTLPRYTSTIPRHSERQSELDYVRSLPGIYGPFF